ncbi:MAG: SDR family NAD(P)-dependent oxidoreductase [Solirubrobacteraceae bacterium]|nr:SDR family NAD(P)-dependent oxidoreductase [Patulibacter sp.]
MSTVDFKGRRAIVTGGGRGLGRSYALELARRGAAVVVSDRPGTAAEPSAADAVVQEIVDAGGQAVASYGDLTTPEGGAEIVQAALDAFGGIDVVVNNAGFLRPGEFHDLSGDDFDAMLGVHLLGAVNVCRAAIVHMREQGYGRIVNTASNAGTFGMPAMANYCAAKAGVLGLTRALSIEGEPFGIKANAILPNASTTISQGTPIPGDQAAQGGSRAYKEQLADRFSPEMVTPLTLFLASEDCPVTGEFYSALAGRFARVFIGVADGWGGETEEAPSIEDVADHFDAIRDLDGYVLPTSVVDEYRIVAEKLTA